MDTFSRLANWFQPEEDDAEHHSEEAPDDTEERIGEMLQQFAVHLEYEMLLKILPPGMYVMPSFENPLTWHGVLFLKRGPYKGATFKFQVCLPADYPDSAPTLSFISNVFHPMVEEGTGRFDTSSVFPQWRPKDHASFALPYLSTVMTRLDHMDAKKTPLNKEALRLLVESPDEFAERASSCARQSVDKTYNNAEGSPLQFTKGPADAHNQVLGWLQDASVITDEVEASEIFVESWCEQYATQRVHVDVSQGQVEIVNIPGRTTASSVASSVGSSIRSSNSSQSSACSDLDGYV